MRRWTKILPLVLMAAAGLAACTDAAVPPDMMTRSHLGMSEQERATSSMAAMGYPATPNQIAHDRLNDPAAQGFLPR